MKTIVAKLIVGKEERELTWVDLNYYKSVQLNGKPAQRAKGGFIAMRFEPQTNDDFFLEWMFADRMKQTNIDPRFRYYKTKDGGVAFYENDFEGRVLFKYDFEEGVPIHYRETFSNERGMEVFMLISAPIQKFRSKTPFIKQWYEKWTPPKEKEKVEKEEELPRILDFYYIDKNNKRDTKLTFGDEIFLVIESSNMINEIVDLKMNVKDVDFMYQGKRLKNDILKDYKINSDIDKIPVQVINEDNEDLE